MHLCPRWCIIFTPPFVSWRRICTQGKIRCTEVQMIASVKRLEVTWDCMSLKRSAMMRLKEKLTSFAFARHCFSNLLISNMSHGYIIQRLEYFAENLSPHINPKLTKFQAAEIGNSANLFRENRKIENPQVVSGPTSDRRCLAHAVGNHKALSRKCFSQRR